jgi:hypothetical protein
MKAFILTILFFLYFLPSFSQSKGFIMRGDTLLYIRDVGDTIQINRNIPPMAGQSGKVLSNNGASYTWITLSGGGDLLADNNLSDLANAATARTNLSLGNVTNESKATMFTNPTFTGTVAGVTASMVGLGNVTNESNSNICNVVYGWIIPVLSHGRLF